MIHFLAFFVGMAIGGLIELFSMYILELILKKPLRLTHRYSFAKKLSLFSLPIWGLIGLLAVSNTNAIKLFILSGIIGTFLEFLLGRGIKSIFHITLWKYNHGQLGKFTSIYSFPYWGGAAFVFLALAKMFHFS